jgi:hypothetical protein
MTAILPLAEFVSGPTLLPATLRCHDITFLSLYGYELRLFHGPDLCCSRILCFHLFSEQASFVFPAMIFCFLIAFFSSISLLHVYIIMGDGRRG